MRGIHVGFPCSDRVAGPRFPLQTKREREKEKKEVDYDNSNNDTK